MHLFQTIILGGRPLARKQIIQHNRLPEEEASGM
jgi:hypothetical protein